MQDAGTSNHVYIHSEEYSWLPARVMDYPSNNEVLVSISYIPSEESKQQQQYNPTTISNTKTIPSFKKGQIQTIALKDYPNRSLPLQNVNEEGILQQVEDMVDLSFLHEPAILYNLQARHAQGKPYTRTGDIILAVNPYQWIMELYSEQNRALYAYTLVWNCHPNNANNVATLSSTTTTAATNLVVDLRATLPPHVYETSSLAYRGLAVDGQDQSILVSGESGAGKTETVKILLSHLASISLVGATTTTASTEGTTDNTIHSSISTSPIVQRVLDSNPLLEAFGNAKTIRNDNSSRFGKYLQLQFDTEDPNHAAYAGKSIPSCVLAGSKCEVYLLEKSRVVGHEEGERSYHIFYQLLAAPDDEKVTIWSGLEGTDVESFAYLGYTDTDTIEGKTDESRYYATQQALALIGIQGDTYLQLMRTLCVVLQLGNLGFEVHPEEDERTVIGTTDELTDLSTLMGVEEMTIQQSITERTVRARNEQFTVPLKPDQAKDSADALAKEIYAKIFLWIVRNINDATAAEWNYHDSGDGIPSSSTSSFGIIGLLDIFGFESFQVNRFEQLCINYANEKLQQKFTMDIFRSVQAEYEAEGIELGEISYKDNADVLNLVEGRMGLIAVLNEECVRPKGSDVAFVSKVYAVNKDSEAFFLEKAFRNYEFGIYHYAGKVKYDATGFVSKNMDTLPSDLLECAKKSSIDIIAQEIQNDAMMNEHKPKSSTSTTSSTTTMTKRPAARSKLSRASSSSSSFSSSRLIHQTVWTKFRSQLTSLMTLLSATRTRYIRCIKPNTFKKPRVMMYVSTVEQLRCAGVVAAVTMSRSAFPNRLEHGIVLERFQNTLWQGRQQQENATTRSSQNSAITNATDLPPSARVELLLEDSLRELETVSKDGRTVKAFVIGNTRAYFRCGALEYLEAARLKGLSLRATDLQRIVRGFVAKSKFQKCRQSAIQISAYVRCFLQRRFYRALQYATIQIQCWIRCQQAHAALLSHRRMHACTIIQSTWRRIVAQSSYQRHRRAVIILQALARGSLQRPRYRERLLEKREETKLENQLKVLQRKLEEAERRRIEAEERAAAKAIEDAKAKAEAEVVVAAARAAEQEQKQQQQQDQSSQKEEKEIDKTLSRSDVVTTGEISSPVIQSQIVQLTAHQQSLMDESGKMLEYLRKEVFKLRTQNSHLRHDFDLLKENNQRLMDANASAGASFAALNQHAKQLHKQNNKLTAELSQYRVLLQKASLQQMELKEELKMKQSTYIAEVHSRLQYQKTMSRIVDKIQQRCRDSRLIEDILQMADDCEEMFLQGPIAASSATTPTSTPTVKSSSSLAAATVPAGRGVMATSSTPSGSIGDSGTSDSFVSRFKSLFG